MTDKMMTDEAEMHVKMWSLDGGTETRLRKSLASIEAAAYKRGFDAAQKQWSQMYGDAEARHLHEIDMLLKLDSLTTNAGYDAAFDTAFDETYRR
jgi:hypothetical protein